MKKTLVIKLGAIGDVVMALPMLESLWRVDPTEQVDWVVGNIAAPVLECVSSDRLRIVRADERAIFRGTFFQRIRAILSLWRRLGLAKYDRILVINGDSRYAILPLLCRGPRQWFRNGEGFRAAVPGRHHSTEYVRMVNGADGVEMPLPVYPKLLLPELPDSVSEAMSRLGSRIVAISPAGAKNVMREEGLRRWHVDGYRETMNSLRAKGISVVLVGGPGDEWASSKFSDCVDLDLVGKVELAEFLSVLQRSCVLVTHDSGPLHLGDLAGTPTVCLFGPTVPDEKTPIRAPFKLLWGGENLACRPCYDGRLYAKCTENRCLTSIDSSSVVEAVTSLLETYPIPVVQARV